MDKMDIALTGILTKNDIRNEDGDKLVDFLAQNRDSKDFCSIPRWVLYTLMSQAYRAGEKAGEGEGRVFRVVAILAELAKERELSEDEFCKRYTYGYLAYGNSTYDILDLFFDADKPAKELGYKTFAHIADEIADLEIEDPRDWASTYLDGYDILKQSAGRTTLA